MGRADDDPGVLTAQVWLLGDLAAVSPDLLSALEPDGTLVAVNPAWQRLMGWHEDEIVGRQLGWMVHPEDREATVRAFSELVERGTQIVDVENRCATRDGEWRWVSWSANVSVETGRVFVSGRDITARTHRHLEVSASETLLAQAERIAHLGSWQWDTDTGEIRYSNELGRIVGLAPGEDYSYAGWLAWVHPEDRGRVREEVDRAVEEQRAFTVEYVHLHPDGSRPIVLERGEPYHDAGPDRWYVGTVQDVSEQRRIEDDLRRALAVEQEAADRLRQLDELKNSFLGAVSHELRTPLTILRGLAETLQHHGDDLDPATRSEIRGSLVEQARRLGHLLTDLLDLNRLLRSGETTDGPAPVDLGELVHTVVATQPRADRIEVAVAEPVRAPIDPVHLERILVNLVDNADKYAPDGPVTVHLGRTPSGAVRLEVLDEGPGIPADALQRVFDPFYRADARHPKPGTGVGLALVTEFARLHGGSAWAENRPEGGARIVVELPTTIEANDP